MSDSTAPLLRAEDLSTRLFTDEGQVNAVNEVDLTLYPGEVVGIVGESGSGKSVTARTIMDLVEAPGRITDGSLWYHNAELAAALESDHPEAVDGEAVDLRGVPEGVRRQLRGTEFSMIFQDPETSFNPTVTVGEQIAEAVEVQRRASARPRSAAATAAEYSFSSFLTSVLLPSQSYISEDSYDRAVELLEMVGIPDPKQRAEEYPHEYSGGMLQRAMIAQALAGDPDILIADEPTTALDVTIQAQILELLRDMQAETDMSILLITHNLGVIARMCNRVGVMYAGEIVERGTLEDIFDHPTHPYTNGLLGSLPGVDGTAETLTPIEGNVPSLLAHEMEQRCYFADRCPKAMEECLDKPPAFDGPGSEGHQTKCYLADHEYDPTRALPEDYFNTTQTTDD